MKTLIEFFVYRSNQLANQERNNKGPSQMITFE